MIPNYEFIEEKFGTKFIAYGSTLEQVFTAAAHALAELSVAASSVDAKERRFVELNSRELETLLHEWLSQILMLNKSEMFQLNEARVARIAPHTNGYMLKARLLGEKLGFKTKAKAITHHEVYFDKMNNRWVIEVTLSTQ